LNVKLVTIHHQNNPFYVLNNPKPQLNLSAEAL
jgi:hypothetical protein